MVWGHPLLWQLFDLHLLYLSYQITYTILNVFTGSPIIA